MNLTRFLGRVQDTRTMPRPLQNLDEIFHAALEISDPVKRAGFLDDACAGAKDLRHRIETLLCAALAADDFFKMGQVLPEAEPGDSALSELSAEKTGTQIGSYRLLEKIGEGGFGIVYRAQQSAPVEREVALKIIKLGMDTREVIRRFEA